MTDTAVHFDLNRRMHTRHRANTNVSISNGKTSKMCQAVNLSADGVAIKTDGMGLKVGQAVTLSFAISLGAVVKIHRRQATVAHVTNGITGFIMERFKDGII